MKKLIYFMITLLSFNLILYANNDEYIKVKANLNKKYYNFGEEIFLNLEYESIKENSFTILDPSPDYNKTKILLFKNNIEIKKQIKFIYSNHQKINFSKNSIYKIEYNLIQEMFPGLLESGNYLLKIYFEDVLVNTLEFSISEPTDYEKQKYKEWRKNILKSPDKPIETCYSFLEKYHFNGDYMTTIASLMLFEELCQNNRDNEAINFLADKYLNSKRLTRVLAEYYYKKRNLNKAVSLIKSIDDKLYKNWKVELDNNVE